MMNDAETTRDQLADTLTSLIERADDDLRKQLFDALNAYTAHGNGMRRRFIKQQPIAAFLIDAIEDGLLEYFIEADEECMSDEVVS